MFEFDFELGRAIDCLFLLGISYILTLPIGWNREKEARSAGLRTFPLVAVTCCAFVIVAKDSNDTQMTSRVFQGVITGLGFIGGGVILKKQNRVSGMSTAAAIWLTGAIGIACAFARFEAAVALALVCVLSLRFGKITSGGEEGDDA